MAPTAVHEQPVSPVQKQPLPQSNETASFKVEGNTPLTSKKWSAAVGFAGGDGPCRFEGELKDLVVLGEVPEAIDGTFYRVTPDPFVPPHPGTSPLDGDGVVSAFRFYKGEVDFSMRYVETERLKIERTAKKYMFGLYRNPYTHHPCVRSAIDSTANTNVFVWDEKLLALKEGGLPYYLDPDTLKTIGYDPFAGQILSKTFTAHPKIDPYTNELVTYGYEAKGLGTLDIVSYSLDEKGVKTRELWIKSPRCAFIHDCGVSTNWQVLFLWPFEADVERMKTGEHHWTWSYDIPATFVVIPRYPDSGKKFGWKEGEHRVYEWKNCMPIHTAGAWEDEDGIIYVESSRVHENGLPFFPTRDGQRPIPNPKADFVRWQFDLRLPSGSVIPDPLVVLDLPSEMPRIDERYMTKAYKSLFLVVAVPDHSHDDNFIFTRLNGVCMHNHETESTRYYFAGEESVCQEPIFIPRSTDAPEGDGYVMTMVDHKDKAKTELVILDTRNFENPIAIVQMPVYIKSQIHGNWVDGASRRIRKPLVKEYNYTGTSGRGALEPLVA